MVKSVQPTATDSTIESSKSQANSATEMKFKAEVYARLKNLTKFDTLIFKRIANNTFPGVLRTMSEWDSFKDEYQRSGSK